MGADVRAWISCTQLPVPGHVRGRGLRRLGTKELAAFSREPPWSAAPMSSWTPSKQRPARSGLRSLWVCYPHHIWCSCFPGQLHDVPRHSSKAGVARECTSHAACRVQECFGLGSAQLVPNASQTFRQLLMVVLVALRI
jgi:hypothetical protein